MFKKWPIVFVMAFALTACQSKPNSTSMPIEVSPEGLSQVVNHTLDSVIIVNVAQWQNRSMAFSNQTEAFCSAPSENELIALQHAFKQMAQAWNQTVMYDFGPLRDNLFFPKIHFIESMRQRGKDYSASIKTHINKRLNDQIALDALYFDKLKFTLVGMSALELLVFTEMPAFENSRQCDLLRGMADLNLRYANDVLSGWKQANNESLSYRDIFVQNRFADGEKSLTKLIFALQDYLRYIRQRKINGKLDYPLSQIGYSNMAIGLKTVVTTLNANQSGYGLTDYMIKAGHEKVVKRLENNVNSALKAINSQDLKAMNKHYLALIKMFETDIPQALGVNLGMNFVDGD